MDHENNDKLRIENLKQRLYEKRNEKFHDSVADDIERKLVDGAMSPKLEYNLNIFRDILNRWKSDVEKQGGTFYVILLPMPSTNQISYIFDEEDNVINLYKLAERVIPEYDYEMFSFKNDGHWNEMGNMFACMLLYKYLVERDGVVGSVSDKDLKEALSTYYAALGGWVPNNKVSQKNVDANVAHDIRNTYLELEGHPD